MKIGLIGDYDASVPAHQAIPIALKLTSEKLGVPIEFKWVPTDEILNPSRIIGFDGLWCVPASPYKNMDGALCAIQYAREQQIPFLGTCGGFQHAIIEYARNVMGWQNAEHAETAPNALRPVIKQMECALVEKVKKVSLIPSTKIQILYGCSETEEGYRCRYGLNPNFEQHFFSNGQLRVGARDDLGEIRAVELANDHPFFIATLFQPERAALRGEIPPLILGFAQAIHVQNKEKETKENSPSASCRK